MTSVPHRHDFVAATLRALGVLGGSGSIEEIREKVIELLAVPDKVDIKELIAAEACVERSRNMKPGILSSTLHLPEMMLNMITRSPVRCFAVHRLRCSVNDSQVHLTADARSLRW